MYHLLGIGLVFPPIFCLHLSLIGTMCLLYLPDYYLLLYFIVFFIVFFISVLRLHFLIKFEIMWWITSFSNNDALYIWLTLVLIDLGLSFYFSNHFINILLGLICISISSALCIVISWYSLSVQCVMYCKSIAFIMLRIKSS